MCGPDRFAFGESILRIIPSSSIAKFSPVFFMFTFLANNPKPGDAHRLLAHAYNDDFQIS